MKKVLCRVAAYELANIGRVFTDEKPWVLHVVVDDGPDAEAQATKAARAVLIQFQTRYAITAVERVGDVVEVVG